ncbi:MAG: hypothetical protein JO041_11160 [Acidobacteria bacterium]|nr:hypothetical protein [Acidobacteriota bacterium]
MKRKAGFLVLALAFVAPTLLMAQQEQKFELGVYADYTRLHNAGDANFWGPAASFGVNMNRWVGLEANMGYQPAQTVNFTGLTTSGGTTTTNSFTSNIRLLEGMFGPKIQAGAGPFRVYGVLKGGFLTFNSSNRNGGAAGFTNAVNSIVSGDTNGVFYPGAGVELGMRHGIGIRAEVGDLMYFDNGANHNLKFMIGPTFRW